MRKLKAKRAHDNPLYKAIVTDGEFVLATFCGPEAYAWAVEWAKAYPNR